MVLSTCFEWMGSVVTSIAHLEVVARRVEGVCDEAIELMVLLHRDLRGRLRPERVDRVGPRAVNPANEKPTPAQTILGSFSSRSQSVCQSWAEWVT
eukprot:COSAG04_NODE_1213_length_7716_cov_4.100565_3_plen_96_part_00